MSSSTLLLTPELYQYLLTYSLREPEILTNLRKKTMEKFPQSVNMQISAEQGQFMQLLIELLQARKTLDVGTFTGYSALAVALSLPADGKVYTFDVDPKATELANDFWQKADLSEKIQLILGPARDSLETLIANGESNSFDFAFIDADKSNYGAYYELCLQLIRPGGLIVIDNVLGTANKKVSDKRKEQEGYIKDIHQLNTKLLKDERITLSMLPIGDGISLARKRTN